MTGNVLNSKKILVHPLITKAGSALEDKKKYEDVKKTNKLDSDFIKKKFFFLMKEYRETLINNFSNFINDDDGFQRFCA